MGIIDYKDLEVWKNGIDIVDIIYRITEKFPKDERFGLKTHMQKTAVSIPSNIAEGFVRQYTKEYTQLLYVSLGSCAELETQLIISSKRGYLSDSDTSEVEDKLKQEMKMLNGLIKSLNS